MTFLAISVFRRLTERFGRNISADFDRNFGRNFGFGRTLEGTIDIPNIPCHSVNNERAIKDTSQASLQAIGIEQTHAHILNLNENRSQIPTSHKKSDFKKN